jgi:phosphotransferase system HPr (HPr) family protein
MARTASAVVTIANKLGLHARPATLFAERASSAQSRITVRRCDQSEPVDGKSIMQMLMLAATAGTQLEIIAEGSDAEHAVKNLVRLVESGFDED